MPDLEFRDAVAADAPAVRSLVVRSYRGESSRTGWTTEADILTDERIDLPGVEQKIAAPDGFVLLGHGAGELVACCELRRSGAQVAYFGLFAVEPRYQAGGIGRRVLDHAERLAVRRWAVTAMELQVIAQRTDLIAWYRRRGYSPTGERRSFPFDALVNGVALRSDLYFAVLAKELNGNGDGRADRTMRRE
jgi:GNAT superfamily N-acetyltransferase